MAAADFESDVVARADVRRPVTSDPSSTQLNRPVTSDQSVVKAIEYQGRQFHIVGAARIDGDSPDLAGELLLKNNPDSVCVGLDPARAKILSDEAVWESLSLREVMRDKLLTALLLNLVLAAYSRKYGRYTVDLPGSELAEVAKAAEEREIPVHLVERDINITFGRAWRSINLRSKVKLILTAIKRLFRYEKKGNDGLSGMEGSDLLTAFVDEVTQLEPALVEPLVEEIDDYSALKIRAAGGDSVTAVVGAGRVDRIGAALSKPIDHEIDDLESLPATSRARKIATMTIPVILILVIVVLSLTQGKAAIRENLVFWILANSLFTGIGAIVAGAHILTILTAVIVAPLSPFIPAGPGTVAALVQLLVRPPLVRDFQTFADDLTQIRRWRRNRILKILLVLVLCGMGSLLGTFLGTSKIILSLFR